MGLLDHLYLLEASQIRGPFLIVSLLYLVDLCNPEAATWTPNMVAIIYHGSTDDREFLFQREFVYTDQFMPKIASSTLKRQHITKVSAQNYYNALFCRYCDLIIIYLSLADNLLSNLKIISR